MADKYSNIVNEATLEIGSNGDLYLNTTGHVSAIYFEFKYNVSFNNRLGPGFLLVAQNK